MPDYYKLGQKHAQQYLGMRPQQDRSYLKDFAAGVDPTGTFTSSYGLADVGTNADKGARRATGIAGGVIGSGVALPMVISGLLNAKKGLPQGLRGVAKAFGEGVRKPIDMVTGGYKARNILRHAPNRGISEAEMQQLKKTLGVRAPEGMRGAIMSKLAPKSLSARQARMIPESLRSKADELMTGTLRDAGTTAGMAGAFGGGSAYMQYNKGQGMGEQMDAPTRQRVLRNS